MRCATLTSPRRTGAALSRDAGQPGGEISFQLYPRSCTSDHWLYWLDHTQIRALRLEDGDVVLLGGVGDLKRKRAEVSKVSLKGLQRGGWVQKDMGRHPCQLSKGDLFPETLLRVFCQPHV